MMEASRARATSGIYLSKLRLSASVGEDAWGREKPQPIILTIKLSMDLEAGGKTDDITQTMSYSDVCRAILSLVQNEGHFKGLVKLHDAIRKLPFNEGMHLSYISSQLPKAILRSEAGIELQSRYDRTYWEQTTTHYTERLENETWHIRDLKIPCIIGVNPHERLAKQTVMVSLVIEPLHGRCPDHPGDNSDNHWRNLIKAVFDFVDQSTYQTLEALAYQVASGAYHNFQLKRIEVAMEKPSALPFVEGAGVVVCYPETLDPLLLS